MKRRLWGLVAATGVIVSGALSVQAGAQSRTPAGVRDRTADLMALRKQDDRVMRVGQRLAQAGAAAGWCESTPSLGLMLREVGQFPKNYRLQARQVWSLPEGSALFVASVAPDSTAARVGLAPGVAILRINGHSPMRNPYDMPSRHALANSERVIDAALAQGPGTIETLDAAGQRQTLSLSGRPACESRFETAASDDEQAYADGEIVQVTAAMGTYTDASDDELAAVVAHELSHNILRHIPRTEAANTPRDYRRYLGRYARVSRKMEEEADRLSVWLLAAAGYSPQAPVSFWGRFGPGHDTAHPFGRTHDRWQDRVAALNDEIALMNQAKASDPRARPSVLDHANETPEQTAARARGETVPVTAPPAAANPPRR
jgi:hypothetical protein